MDQADDLATGDVRGLEVLSSDEATVALKALGFYNWSSDQLAEKLESDRARLSEINELITACMAQAGFSYFPVAPEDAIQLWTGFEYQYGTRPWSDRYGLGLTTLRFLQRDLPDGLVGAPHALPVVEGREDSDASIYLESLGEDGRRKYYETLNIGEKSCQNLAHEAIPEFANTEHLDFGELDLEDVRARALSSKEYQAASSEASRCLRLAGYEIDTESEAYDLVTKRVIESGFETNGSVDFASSPPRLSSEGEQLLASLQGFEIDLAKKLWDCGATSRQLNEVASEIGLRILVEAIAEDNET